MLGFEIGDSLRLSGFGILRFDDDGRRAKFIAGGDVFVVDLEKHSRTPLL